MRELIRWRYLPMHGIALGLLILVVTCGQPVNGTGAPEVTPTPASDERRISSQYYFVSIICDKETGNLVYLTSNGGISVVKDGCSK